MFCAHYINLMSSLHSISLRLKQYKTQAGKSVIVGGAKLVNSNNIGRKRPAWTTEEGRKKYGMSPKYGRYWKPKEQLIVKPTFKPSQKLKEHTIIGPSEGKGSWRADFSPSVIETVTGEFCPGAIVARSETKKEKIMKEKKYEDKIPRVNYTRQEKLKGTVMGDYILVDHFGKPVESDNEEVADKEENKENLAENLHDAIDGLYQKSGNGRAKSLMGVHAALCRRLMPDTVLNNRYTLTDALERALRKGRGSEQLAAAKLAPILCIQLAEDQSEEFVKVVKPAFVKILTDKFVDVSIRAECCLSLATITFLTSTETADVFDLMGTCEKIFSGSYLKDDDSSKENARTEGLVHAAALDAWSLLLTLCSPDDVLSLLGGSTTTFSPSLSQLTGLLQAPSVEVRMSAGATMALAYELGSEYSEVFGQDELDTIIAEVQQLSKDSNKFRAKKERKIQRVAFRNLLKYFEENETPVERVCVGDESLKLNLWTLHIRYQRLAASLGSGLQVASGTSLLRSALHMGPLVHHNTHHKTHKHEKNRQNTIAAKARTISRAVNRDKRSAVMGL